MKFERKEIKRDGEWITYRGQFVARIRASKNRTGFIKFLIQNFTIGEYFLRLKSGMSPLEILETKGYVPATVIESKKLLKLS